MLNPLLSSTNHLFELARSGKRLPHIILTIVLIPVFLIIAQLTGGILLAGLTFVLSTIGLFGPNALQELGEPKTAIEQTLLLIFGFGPIFLVIRVWLALFEKRSLWSIGMEQAGMWQKYLRGLLVGLLMFSTAVGISAALGYIAVDELSSTAQGGFVFGGVVLVFLGWMVQGAAEETLTRGWLFQVIGARYSPMLGLIVSSLVFAGLHSFNFFGLDMEPAYIGLALLNLFLFAVFAVLYTLYEDGLWGIFSIHAVWNWAQGNVFGFEVSGLSAPGGTFFNLKEVGPDAITGGVFGPEGGLAVTIVLLISCATVWWLGLRQKSQLENPATY